MEIQLEKIQLAPGDFLLVRVPEHTSMNTVEAISKQLGGLLDGENRVVIMPVNFSIKRLQASTLTRLYAILGQLLGRSVS